MSKTKPQQQQQQQTATVVTATDIVTKDGSKVTRYGVGDRRIATLSLRKGATHAILEARQGQFRAVVGSYTEVHEHLCDLLPREGLSPRHTVRREVPPELLFCRG